MPQSLEEMAIALATKLAAPVHVDKFKGDLLAALSAARAQGLEDAAQLMEHFNEDEDGEHHEKIVKVRKLGRQYRAKAIRALLDSPSAAPERPADREEVDLREATERVRAEILRQHQDIKMQHYYALIQGNKALNITDLAKAALGMRVMRWDEP